MNGARYRSGTVPLHEWFKGPSKIAKAGPAGPSPAELETTSFVSEMMRSAPFSDADRATILRSLGPVLQACGVEVDTSGVGDPKLLGDVVAGALKEHVGQLTKALAGELRDVTSGLTKALDVKPPRPQPRVPSASVIWGDDLGVALTQKSVAGRKQQLEAELEKLPVKHADDFSKQITERERITRELRALG